MKVLWFTHLPMPPMLGRSLTSHAGTGSWMVALLECLKNHEDITLAIACISLHVKTAFLDIDGIRYYPIHLGSSRRFFHFTDFDNSKEFHEKCMDIIKEYQPDIVHVHGTERPYGMVGTVEELDIPVVISIQGLLSECSKWRNTFGNNIKFADILKMHKLVASARGIGPIFDYFRYVRAGKREKKIIRGNRYFLGRTSWDKSHLYAINPDGCYYHVDEMLRKEFGEHVWCLNDIQRHSIIFTNMRSPRHDVDTIFAAVSILKRSYPNIRLYIAGQGNFTGEYGNYLLKRARKLRVENTVHFLGRLNAKEMAMALTQSHIFVHPSLIENSPNSLCEAQLAGVPCIATYTGGIPSLITDDVTGLLFQVGDAAQLATSIHTVFLSDELAVKLSTAARKEAQKRHDDISVVRQLVRSYEHILEQHENIATNIDKEPDELSSDVQ